MEDFTHSDRPIDDENRHEVQQEENETAYLKFDWLHRHSQLRRLNPPDKMKNQEGFSLNSPESSPRIFRRSFDIHMLRPETDIFDLNYRSLSDSELDRQNNSSMTSEFMDLPKRLPLHTRRTYGIDGTRPRTLQSSGSEKTTSAVTALPLPKIEFSNIHVVVEDIDCERKDLSGFYIGDSNYTSEDFGSGNSGMWMNLEPKSHALLSPRSSNGSICSYRSSNADSAIEILTPDEDIPDHSVSESSDSRFWENRQSQSDVTNSHTTLESVHSHGATSNLHFISVTDMSNQTSLCSHDASGISHSPISYTEKHPTSDLTSSAISLSSQKESIQGHERSISPADVHKLFHPKSPSPSLSSAYSYRGSNQQSSSDVQDISSFQFAVPKYNPKSSVPSTQSSQNFQGRSFSVDSKGRSLPTSSTFLSQGPSLPTPPSVVISDFSNRLKLRDKGSQTVDTGTSSSSETAYLTDSSSHVRRSLSNCSISSNESSTFSVLSDSSLDLEDAPVLMRPKTSSWKKIRNIVHWSPFIQQFKRRKYPWIQLAGHQGNFQAGDPGAILKKYDKREYMAFKKLMKDVLRPYVPEYRGDSSKDGERFVQLQDLLCEFEAPCVMDMKIGCKTYLEEELIKARENPTLRKDMYQKMLEVDPSAPTEEEHNQKAITKPRYMQWRDDMSSSSSMGFRIEGIRKSDGAQVKSFKKTKDKKSVKECLKLFVEENPHVVSTYLRRLKAIRATQEISPFFKSHEIIGSSLLFVHDRGGLASIWMIDFGKTVPLPENLNVTHRNQWSEGNHEDGYLFGMDSLIEIFDELNTEYSNSETNVKCKTTDTESSSETHHVHQKDSSDVISVHADSDQVTRLKGEGDSSTV